MDFANIQHVIILAGGPSAEAEVSRSTARGMAAALATLGVAHGVWELEGDWLTRLAAHPKQGLFVLIALHGCPGEDGTVQGLLDLLGIPYQGSGVLGCALAMDKIRARQVMAAHGLDVAEALWGEELNDPARVHAFKAQRTKMVVKPAASGSSVGVSLVEDMADWPTAYARAAAHGPVLMEDYIAGRELTVGMLGQTALPIVEIVANTNVFYDYNNKYATGGSTHICPAALPQVVAAAAQQGAIKAAQAVGATGASRIDFRYDEQTNRLVVLEVNTLPGLTPTSLLPDAARYATPPMDYPALVRWMIEDGLKQVRTHTA